MQHPFSFLNDYADRGAYDRRETLVRIERSIDKAIKFPSEQTAWQHPVVLEFEKWLRENTRHSIPVTFKSEWALMSAILQQWPKDIGDGSGLSRESFRSWMSDLVKMRQTKSFHKQYVFQAMVHFEEFMWKTERAETFWLPVFVDTRELGSDEVDLCRAFDSFHVCKLEDADWKLVDRACQNPGIKREKIRQFAVIVSFMRSRGFLCEIERLCREGVWMQMVLALGQAHSAGPSYWCGIADNMRHLMRSLGLWDTRHKISFRVMKQEIRQKNVHLMGRVLNNRHVFVDGKGDRRSFLQSVAVYKGLKRRIDVLEREKADLASQLERAARLVKRFMDERAIVIE